MGYNQDRITQIERAIKRKADCINNKKYLCGNRVTRKWIDYQFELLAGMKRKVITLN